MGRQVHRGERKPSGFWSRPEVRRVFAEIADGKIDRREAERRLGIADYGEPMATRTFDWYMKKYLREAKGGREPSAAAVPEVERVAIGLGGRVVIPASYRHALGLKEGDEVSLRMEEGELRLTTPDQALRRAQALVRRHVDADRSLADELIAERRREARHE